MGFMDKAKKLAEQAQAKLDEVQKDFNASQGSGGQSTTGPVVEYDKHGRPVTPPEDRLVPEPGPSHTQGDPADQFPGTAPPAASGDPLAQTTPAAPVPEAGPDKEQGDPADRFPTADEDVPPAPADKSPTLEPPPADKSPTFPPKEPPGPGAAPGMTSGDPLAG